MLPKISLDPIDPRVTFEKFTEDGKNVTAMGAFACGTVLRFVVTCPRILGATAVVLRLCRDGGEETDTPFTFISSDPDTLIDRYELTVDTAALCAGDASGLFYYRLLFVRLVDTLFTDSLNNVDFELVPKEGATFHLLVHEADYTVPAWFGEGVMYHVFVDRFFRGYGTIRRRRGERAPEINQDWENGIPQYAEKPGDFLSNHIHFGGNLWGVIEKLDYLDSLGVKVIYLSPIFEAYSNHKYDTGDYLAVDGGFGGNEALDALIEKAKEHGIRIILDGVFNHTGDDSLYFNRYGLYDSNGAYMDEESTFHNWYHFRNFPDEYESWWGIDVLPKLNHNDQACRRHFTGVNGVGAEYIRRGIAGWRLDVADELNDIFLDEFRASVKGAEEGAEPIIIGEVWENAAEKVAYGKRRRYLQGKQLDSVMNYPVRSAILGFIRDGDAEQMYDTLTEIYASYPRSVSDALMNLVGTHDTERILSVLGSTEEELSAPNPELATARLAPAARAKAIRRLKLASLLQFTVFGMPSLYYGDEVGMEGGHDPFCRRPFPWHELEDETCADLLAHYRGLGALRQSPAFHGGDFRILDHGKSHIVYERAATDGSDRVVIVVHRGAHDASTLTLGADILANAGDLRLAIGDVEWNGDTATLTLTGDSACVLG